MDEPVHDVRLVASTTALLNPWTKQWDKELFERIGIKPDLFPEVVASGTPLAHLSEALCKELGLKPVPVISVASHCRHLNTVIGTPQARWRETHQSGRFSIMP